MTESYDSKADTLEHKQHVRNGLGYAIQELVYRAQIHDDTKLSPEEKDKFDELTPKLKEVQFGSEEYEKYRLELGTALKHHYDNQRHHPEHHLGGVKGMNLVDVLEMLIDWHASTKRHDSSRTVFDSIETLQGRFGYSDELKFILVNTARWLVSQELNSGAKRALELLNNKSSHDQEDSLEG